MSSLRNLDLNLLKVFDAIFVSNSVSGAAKLLGMSQPSVSRALSKLRIHFDDPLFERSGNGVLPTAKAEGMLASVRSALSLIDKAIIGTADFDPSTQTRHFRMILPDPIEVVVMPSIIKRLPEGSNVTFETLSFSDFDLSKAFKAGDIDAGVAPFLPESSNFNYKKLYSEKGALIARKGHPQLTNGFNPSCFNQLGFVSLPAHLVRLSRLHELLSAQGITIRTVCISHKISSIPRIVETTDLAAFMPLSYATMLRDRWDIDVFELPDMEATRQDVYLLTDIDNHADPAINWICAEISAAYEV